MAYDQQQDSILFDRLDLPYDRVLRELDPTPRLTNGKNAYVTFGGKIAKRPGTLAITNTTINGRVDRLWIYDTLDTPPKVYLIASVKIGATWTLYYNRLDGTSPGWTSFGSYRDIDVSTRAHEGVQARGLFFAKGYPGTTEKLGTVVFDGSPATPTVRPWGTLGPTEPARMVGAFPRLVSDITAAATTATLTSATGLPAAPFNMQIDFETVTVTAIGGVNITAMTRAVNGTIASAHTAGTVIAYYAWNASAHPVTVFSGWTYSYCWKDLMGHYTNRAPVEINPDKNPSSTGPFYNMKPDLTVQGHADTTNYPKVVVLRTTDGGGTFYILQETVNTGAGAIAFTDQHLGSGASGTTYADPLPDTLLSQNDFAPSLTSNSPPPSVNAPLVTGTDAIIASTPLAYYCSRIWYAIGNILYYSSSEELPIGIPEQAFPSGVKGNFFRFQNPIINLKATSDALFIVTLKEVYEVSGTNKETFNPKVIFNNIGAPYGHPRAMDTYGENIVFLSQDYRVLSIGRDFKVRVISDPLFTDIVDAVNAGGEVEIRYWAELDKEWLIVNVVRNDSPTLTKQFVYDIKKSEKFGKDFWFVPWNIPAVCAGSGRINETTNQRRLFFFLYDATANSQLVRIDSTGRTGSDDLPGAATSTMDFNIRTNLLMAPAGNHLNQLRVPDNLPVVDRFVLERTKYVNDTDPRIYYYADDLWTDPIETFPLPESMSRKTTSKGYETQIFSLRDVAHRISFEIIKNQSTDLFEVQNLQPVWLPDSGSML